MGTHTRRDVLTLGAVAGLALTVPVARRVSASSIVDGITAGLPEPAPTSPFVPAFSVPLAIPPVLEPVRSVGETDYFEIVQRETLAQILPGRTTPVWSYNGMVPGPSIPMTVGRTAVITQINQLRLPTCTHLHGGRTPAESDGHPLDVVPPGGSRVYTYPDQKRYSPLWYHDHSIHDTGLKIWMGLAGRALVSDPLEEALPLPRGAFDIPLMIFDRLFNADNSLLYPLEEGHVVRNGALGDVILVNGRPQPRLAVKRRKYRFRLLNASNSRQYLLALDRGLPLVVVASEGSLMPSPVTVAQLPMGNAERYDVVVDFSSVPSGTRVVLQNLAGKGRTAQVMAFDVGGDAPDPSSVPAVLRDPIDINPADAVATREFRFDRSNGGWTINNRFFDENRIDAFPRFGTTEIWTFINKSGGWTHPVHPHLVHYRVLDRNGAPPKPWEAGLKDVVMVGPGERIRVAMRFDSYRGIYAFHCHNAEHEDHDMMTQFQVV
jgi:FtsP/CotA-like multicopper oxidase with cupredoxin domain